MAGFVFIVVGTFGSPRVRIRIVEPITIRWLKCVVRGDKIISRNAELSTRRSVAEITVNAMQKRFYGLGTYAGVNPSLMSAIPNTNWL